MPTALETAAAEILIVDDEPAMRDMLSEVLGLAGYHVRQAGNGEQAWQACGENQFQVVITDLLMPDCDGIELIMRLRRARPQLPVIAISGGGRIGPTDYLRLAQRCGAVRTFMKPFSTSALLATVRSVLEGDGGGGEGAERPTSDIGFPAFK